VPGAGVGTRGAYMAIDSRQFAAAVSVAWIWVAHRFTNTVSYFEETPDPATPEPYRNAIHRRGAEPVARRRRGGMGWETCL